MYDYAMEHAQKVSLFGCSRGAYFQLLAFADAGIDCAWLLSPVTDMERIIHNLMDYCHISEEEFRERVLVENDMEPLYFPYYEYVRKNPVTKWKHQTYILRGENDTLCEYAYVKSFADRFGCEMTVQKNGGGTGFIRKKNWTFSVTGCGKDCNSDMWAGCLRVFRQAVSEQSVP